MYSESSDSIDIKEGHLIDLIRDIPLFTPDEEHDCVVRLQSGNPVVKKAARDEMVLHNIRLVVSVAKKYIGTSSLDFDDLIQCGIIGLIRASDAFDYTLGYKFSTYATFWIKQSINKAIVDTSNTIRLPSHANDDYVKIKRFVDRYHDENRKYPTDIEISKALKISIDHVKLCRDDINQMVRLDAYTSSSGHSSSDTTPLADLIPDTGKEIDEDIIINERDDQLMDVIRTLKPNAQEVLSMRYGLNNETPMTYEAIGKIMHISKERVRQIEVKAIRDLRRSIKVIRLREYIE